MRNPKLVPYETIIRATSGEPETVDEMAGKVVENIARKFENVREGVKSVMGGRVLEYEAKTILRQGIEEGIKEGKMEQAKETAFALRAMGLKKDAIEKAVNVNAAQLEECFLEKPAEA